MFEAIKSWWAGLGTKLHDAQEKIQDEKMKEELAVTPVVEPLPVAPTKPRAPKKQVQPATKSAPKKTAPKKPAASPTAKSTPKKSTTKK